MNSEKQFPDKMVPLAGSKFRFSCHHHVPCFTICCKNVDMLLYPYDIVRLKQALKIRSSQVLKNYTRCVRGDNLFFPTVMLKLQTDEMHSCPFLEQKTGCSVYADRPSACRTYPLERAVDRTPEKGKKKEYYFLTQHDYCQGHKEDLFYSVNQWIRDQRLHEYNLMNELWAEIDTLFSRNPWQGEGQGGPKQQLAFMVCYDIDGFRDFVCEKRLMEQFFLTKDTRRLISQDDGELLKFGFEWLKFIFNGKSSLVKK